VDAVGERPVFGLKKYTMQELFYELEGIELNYLDGCEPFISELTDKQMKLYKIFGVPAPEE
jgi:hypothetical protein